MAGITAGMFRWQKGQSYSVDLLPHAEGHCGGTAGSLRVRITAGPRRLQPRPRAYLPACEVSAVDEHLLLQPNIGLVRGPLQG